MKKLLIAIILVAGNYATAFAQESRSETFEGVETIELNTGVGDLVVAPSGSGAVEVQVSYHADRLEPVFTVRGKKLILDEEEVSRKGNASTAWVLKVPAGITLTSNSGTGRAEFSDLAIAIDHNSGTGRVTADRLTGTVKLNSGTGRLVVNDSEGTFDLNSGTGNVIIEGFRGALKANSGTGRVEVSEAAIREESSFNSGTGDVRVQLGAPPAGDLSIGSGTGDSLLDFNGQPVSGYFEMRCEERRGKIVAPFSFDNETMERQGRATISVKSTQVGDSNVHIRVSCHSGKAEVRG